MNSLQGTGVKIATPLRSEVDSDDGHTGDPRASFTPAMQSNSSQSSFTNNDDDTSAMSLGPPVVVGMACRLAGATNTHELWKVLAEKADMQKKMPENRFNIDSYYHPQGTNKGTTNARYGYFLDQGLDEFDAQFFGISGKEAEAMDPQQRLLLEVVYEALENAGIPMESVSGTQTSVFAGSFSNDYLLMTHKDLTSYPKYTVTGVGNSVISNRISYCFNLHGPSVTIDTACSSSLVCFHMACESLNSGESDIAIVCGSALHFDPNIFVTMTDFGMLSSDGRCRTFDAKGSGYVRGEGVCAIILKRQRVAEVAGDRIRAVVRATGSNHDGTKEGLTLPNDKAQEMLLRATYSKAKISTADTQYFEAHGTGTAAGDPREIRAIANVFASERDVPLVVGSIKSNLGHTEGASGASGIIKTVLSLESGKILPNMHFEDPNPKIDFEKSKIIVPTQVMDWPAPKNGVSRASINSFGYGGTNAHVVLEKYIPQTTSSHSIIPAPQSASRPYLLPLTSHSDKAGQAWCEKLAKYIEDREAISVAEVAHTLGSRRSMHATRSFAIGNSKEDIVSALRAPQPIALWRKRFAKAPRLGFVFTGQGAQWHAMGRDLIETCPLFLQTLQRCDTVLQKLPDAPSWSCVDELLKSAEDSLLSRSMYSQPLCAALQLGIIELLTSWGIKPSGVVGHSSGEIVAAYAAGILSFENSIICAYYRGLYMSKGADSDSKGAMMAVGLTESEAAVELNDYTGRIMIAAVNSPSSLTLSGDEDAIVDLKVKLDERGVFARQLQVEQAFHSHHMTPLAPAFQQALAQTPGFKPMPAIVPMFSSVTARNATYSQMDGLYWATNMIGQVKFSDALTDMLLDENEEARVDVLVEIGAHPALKGPSKQTMKALNLDLPYIGSLDRKVPAYESILSCVGQLFALGYDVDLDAVNVPTQKLQDLPTYAWDHGKYWAETRLIREQLQRPYRHTILGAPVPGAPSNHLRFRNYLRQSEIPWLRGHMIDGKVIFPAAGYLSMAIEAAALRVPNIRSFHLKDVSFKSALTVADTDEGTEVMLDLVPQVTSSKTSSSVWYRFAIFSFDATGKTIENCHGLILAEAGEPASLGQADVTFEQAEISTTRSQAVGNYYERLATAGLQYGSEFRLLHSTIESGDGFAISPLRFEPSMVLNASSDACIVHPTMLDASFHTIFGAIESRQGRNLDDAFVPTFIRNMKIAGVLDNLKDSVNTQNFWIKSQADLPGSRVAHSTVDIVTEDNNELVIKLEGFELTALGNDSSGEKNKRWLFFRSQWEPAFSLLGKGKLPPTFENIGSVMSSFVHQFPDSRILHLSSGVQSTEAVIKPLTNLPNGRRCFKSISLFSPSGKEQIEEELNKLCPEFLDSSEPEEGSFDLVVVSNHIEGLQPENFATEGGFVIFDNVQPSEGNLNRIFNAGNVSAWTLSSPAKAPSETTILISPRASTKTCSLVKALQSSFPAISWNTVSIDMLSAKPKISDTIVSLVSLDEDMFFHRSDEETYFSACQKLLASSSTNVVWLLSGSALDTRNPGQALAVGLFRTIRHENENLRLVTLDIPAEHDESWTANRIMDALDSSLKEDELVERDGEILIQRVVHDDRLDSKLSNGGHRQPRLEPFIQERSLALKIGKVGLLDTLQFEDDEELLKDLHPDDLEIEVKASALNFRDIAASIGIIDDYRLGDECAGIVAKIGANYEGKFQIGDRVAVWCPGQGSHRRFNRVKADYCYKISDDMDITTAACIHGVTTTAYYSLVDVARLQPGEYCLVHAGAGGVGQQAIQIAQMIGAKVIATCGAQAKRDYLKQAFGLTDDHIFSSRDASFVEGVLKVTGGRGVDVALNSLAGELLQATWSCIAPFGRMIEIGKRDIHENSNLGMDPFRKNISYCSVDLITIHNLNRALGARLVRDSFRIIEAGKIKPPGPIEVVTYAEVQKGFRLLQMGKFFGKVCLVPTKEDMVPVVPPVYRHSQLFDAEKTYLLVGGLGGIGRALAQWATRKGARKLAFLSRSGDSRPDARATVEWLRARQVHVTVFKADVSNSSQVDQCIRSIGDSLAGIFQAAMVLQDAPFESMTIEQWQKCVHPKVHGAYNLHQATLSKPLDFFICFSSGSAMIGATGQSNYSSANCYLDALMKHRRQNGLSGFTMNIGRVGGVGVVAENEELNRIMDRIGYDVVNEEELFWQIEEAVLSSSASVQSNVGVEQHLLLTGVNLTRPDLYWSETGRFRNLYKNHDYKASTGTGSSKSLSAKLRGETDIDNRGVILQDAFIEKIAAVLAAPLETIQPDNPLSLYGLDSIVAVEFRKWFSGSVGVELALFDILSSKSIGALVLKVNSMISAVDSQASTNVAVDKKTKSSNVENKKSASADVIILPTKSLDLAATQPAIRQSSFQTRMWYAHNTVQRQEALNFSVTLDIEGTPQIDLLQQAIDELVNRNQILRTAYQEGDEHSEQLIRDDVKYPIDFVDLSAEQDFDTALRSYIKSKTAIPLDIEEGENVRFGLVKRSSEKCHFVLVSHHIAMDSGSTFSALTQLTQLYTALYNRQGFGTVSLPPYSYVDFTLWHQQQLDRPEAATDLAWWKNQYVNAPAAMKLLPFAASDRPRSATHVRQIVHSKVGSSTLKRLKRVCGRMDVTPFQFALAAFRSFLWRYTQEDDVTFLMVDGSRPHSAFQDLMGFFVNMLPVRLRSGYDTSFDQVLKSTKGAALDSLARSQIPFDEIVHAVVPRSSQGAHSPLGQVAVNYQIYANQPKFTTPDFAVVNSHAEDIPTACDLALEVVETPDEGLNFRLEYDAYLYGSSDMDRFIENFAEFFQNAVADYRQPVKEIAMCGPSELRHLQRNCMNIEAGPNFWNDQTIYDRTLQKAAENPAKIALRSSNGDIVSYQDLLKHTERLTAVLQQSGISPGQAIGIYADPSVGMIASMLAAARLRCPYVPLDTQLAESRMQYMLQDSSITAVLAEDQLVGQCTRISGGDVKVIPFAKEPKTTTPAAPIGGAAADDVFYILYTSGSTGKPKGVKVTHENLQALLSNHEDIHKITASDRILFQSTMSFDVSVAQIWGALTAGATICMVSKDLKASPVQLATFMKSSGVTVTFSTPSEFAILLEHASTEIRECKDLRVAAFMGEHLPSRVAKTIYDVGLKAQVVNEYGPTETIIVNTAHMVSRDQSADASIPVGRPFRNNSLVVVDAQMHPVPVHVVGEVCFGGVQVAAGYLNRPEATSKSFLKDPFASPSLIKNGWDTLYRTGDVGFFNKSGELEITGRISDDRQVKLRGYRIDLGEIENEIFLAAKSLDLSTPIELAVLLHGERTDHGDERQLIAFIGTGKHITTDEQQGLANKIHTIIRRALNAYMLPNGYQFTDVLPKLISGKVDRRNLSARPLSLTFASTNEAPTPSNGAIDSKEREVLQTVTETFRSVLRLPDSKKIAPSSNFFELGGQSILLLRLQAQLKKKLNNRTPLLELFSVPTPLGVAMRILGKPIDSLAAEVGTADTGKTIDWEAETSIDSAIRPSQKHPIVGHSTVIKEVLLIGAETFAGSQMLSSLLAQDSKMIIHALGSEVTLDMHKIFQELEDQNLIHKGFSVDQLSSRVHIVPGNLLEAKFGLDAATYSSLATRVSSIYHFGGHVSLLKSYSDLSQINVNSVKECVRLASIAPEGTRIHYLSTWSVPHLQSWADTKFQQARKSIKTDEVSMSHFTPSSTDSFGYFKSKWAAEMVLNEAAHRGFPVSIYRASAVTASLNAGIATPDDNFTQNMITGIFQSGVAPAFEQPVHVDFAPIDYVTQAIARLSTSTDINTKAVSRMAQIFHIGNPKPLLMRELPGIAAKMGKDVALATVEEWVHGMLSRASNDASQVEVTVVKSYIDNGHQMFALNQEQTLEQLKQLGGVRASCPPVDEKMLMHMLKTAGVDI